jgi:hypothetical protein
MESKVRVRNKIEIQIGVTIIRVRGRIKQKWQ